MKPFKVLRLKLASWYPPSPQIKKLKNKQTKKQKKQQLDIMPPVTVVFHMANNTQRESR